MNKYDFILQATTPISHGDTATGINNSTNVRLFMRTVMILNGVPAKVPSISENSLRSVIFRKTLADHLFETAGAQPQTLNKSVMNLFYSGGNLKGGAKAPAGEHELGRNIMTLYPMLELLSGSVDCFILPAGKLRLVAVPVTKEYAPILQQMREDLVEEARTISIYDAVSEETRTRGTGDESEGNQMIYTYETLAPGVKILMRCVLASGASELCRAALGFGVNSWDRFFGGQGRQGRGYMSILENGVGTGEEYHQYISDNKEPILEGLLSGKLGTTYELCT